MSPSNPRITLEWVEEHVEDGDTETENKSGYAIKVDGREMTRVAFVRRFGANPNAAFQEQLDTEIEKAQIALARHAEVVESFKALFPETPVVQ